MAPGRECMRLRLEAAAACAADEVIAGTAKYLCILLLSKGDREVLWGLLEQAWLAGRSSAAREQERLTRPRE